ncbi:Olfactory receptor 7G2 [Sciurus carolinensis]|uniref:Olfactory receptor 7G2 n=1 Tax=Sciurus carolinensis TaxID=30640 RepID=A0AA41MGM0_SCICA|nr:Olfactory receptor 7G2 [Sciurus carolinensis]
MKPRNETAVSECLLLGLTDDPALQSLIFSLFLSMYLVTILSNLLITLAVSSDTYLHTPMYFFLFSLSFNDIFLSTCIIPKMLVNIQTQDQSITYTGCLSQVCFVILFTVLENSLLAVMSYDHYVAICHPRGLGVYMSSAVTDSPRKTAVASVMYTMVPQNLNPFIYSLKNKAMKEALRKLIVRTASQL